MRVCHRTDSNIGLIKNAMTKGYGKFQFPHEIAQNTEHEHARHVEEATVDGI
jgi:hypothetical protein